MDKKLYDKRKKPDCKKEQQRKEIFSTYSELCPQKPQDNRLSGLETGNKKTGKSGRIYDKILVWNIPPRITCSGVSDWCSTHCYNADGEYVPPISYDSLRGDLEGAFSNHDNDDYGLQNRIIACHGVGCDLRMYVQQSDFTIHSTAERLDQIFKLDESCDYFYKIRIPQQIRKQLLAQLDAMGFHESSIYPDMEHIAKEQADSHFNF